METPSSIGSRAWQVMAGKHLTSARLNFLTLGATNMSVLLTHACNDLRQAFNEAVEDGQPVDRHVALQLAECEDIMPRLEVAPGIRTG